MAEQSQWVRAAVVLGGLLAVGLIVAAGVLGYNARLAASQRQSIAVKGLAEKPVKADRAELVLVLSGKGSSAAESLNRLRSQRPQLEAFFKTQGLSPDQIQVDDENFISIKKRNDKGLEIDVVDFYYADQAYTLRSKNVDQIAKIARATLALRENGMQLNVTPAQYLVSNLEEVKMSLIGSATQNAFARAGEFARNGNAKVGQMKSAAQGAFYILPATGRTEVENEYGGVYDKSSIDKIARVVVTIEYAIQP